MSFEVGNHGTNLVPHARVHAEVCRATAQTRPRHRRESCRGFHSPRSLCRADGALLHFFCLRLRCRAYRKSFRVCWGNHKLGRSPSNVRLRKRGLYGYARQPGDLRQTQFKDKQNGLIFFIDDSSFRSPPSSRRCDGEQLEADGKIRSWESCSLVVCSSPNMY